MKCKYCHESIIPSDENFPCDCKDPVHTECLDKWNRKRKYPEYFRCEICDSDYKNNNICENCKKNFLYKIPQKLQILFSLFVLTLLMLISYKTLIDLSLDKIQRNKNATTIERDEKMNFLMND